VFVSAAHAVAVFNVKQVGCNWPVLYKIPIIMAWKLVDFILGTIPDAFDINPYVSLLGIRGSLVTAGLLGPYKEPTNNMEVAKYSRSIGASIIGSVRETQEVLDFCAEHRILPHVEMIEIEDINKAFDKIKEEEVRFRYVVDMKSLKEAEA
jgi:uncharacterized zinc-type alcohol dehydrogenase-like protein